MPQPRKYKTNAERQKAYRDRKKRREAEARPTVTGLERITEKVMAAEAMRGD